MELIKRTTLNYRNKIYQVNLYCVGENRYLVNFSYKERGNSLKEGTKTVESVPLLAAERIFNQLVNSKIEKGYKDTEDIISNHNKPSLSPTQAEIKQDPKDGAILDRLYSRYEGKSEWPLERVIWRAGELKITAAAPILIELIGTGEPLRDYCIAWALGWCGDKEAIPALQALSRKLSTPEFVVRICWEAVYKLSDDRTSAEMRSNKIRELPKKLGELAKNGTVEDFSTALDGYLDEKKHERFAILDTIYQIDNEIVRPALIKILRQAPLKPNYFKPIRHIFKMAEYRHDGEVFGILAYKFEKNSSNFNNPVRGDYYDRATRQYIYSKERIYNEQLKKPRSQLAYSEQTRQYLRRRIWRTLRKLGAENDSNYINMAVQILLQYSDNDAQTPKESKFSRHSNRRNTTFTSTWDKYAAYLCFNHILYENSSRYVLKPNNKAWSCQSNYKPGDPEPQQREEAFPDLWDEHPQELLKLLLKSRCTPVHHFAVKGLQNKQAFLDRLEIPIIIQLLSKQYLPTVELAFSLARKRYDSYQPESKLVLAAANCILEEGRSLAYQWIESDREYFFSDGSFIASLVAAKHPDTRSFARRLLSTSIIDDTTAKILIVQIIAILVVLEENQAEMAKEVGETLLVSFTPQLRSLGFDIIEDLLAHPLPEIQTIAARIILNHEIPAPELPSELIESFLASPYDNVRGVGIRIFGQLSDRTLMSEQILIIAMAVNSSPDIRSGIRPIIRRLATKHLNFAIELAIDFIDLLTEPERHQGVHQDLALLLREDISGWISNIDKDKVMQLIRSKSIVARELAGFILQENCDRFVNQINATEIVKLANNEILVIREATRKIFLAKLDSISNNSAEMQSAIKLLEAKWDDTREFAFEIFSQFDSQQWTPEIMINICDSIREDVRRFGRDLVTRNFQENSGQAYLLKFSEHPSADMQIFATNYLEQYAVNSPEKLQELAPYFVTVLSGVNKGRVAKQRIFKFLESEAEKSEAAAKIVGEILTRQSVTMAIGDRANSIQIMLQIKRKYPQIDLPLQVKEVVEIRR